MDTGIMKFKKGSRVEVLSKTDVSLGVWRHGEIISGNRQIYWVRYDDLRGLRNKDDVEKVSRKAIRPCPPPPDLSDSWTVGDLVEVFDDLYWKTAAVLKVVNVDYYLVRLVGSSKELQLDKVNMRARQLWKDGKWVAIGKGSGSYKVVKSSKSSTLRSYQKIRSPLLQANKKRKVQGGENCLAVENNSGFQESCILSAWTSKRAFPFWSSEFEPYAEKVGKMRTTKKYDEDQREIFGYPSSFLKKVDGVAYTRECLGDVFMHASPKNQTIGSYEMEKGTPNYFADSFYRRRVESNDSDSDACSVGSCSVISCSSNKPFNCIVTGNSPDVDTLSSDAESICGSRDEKENGSIPLEEDIAARIHRLELHAYRCTLQALYASGPLIWEQEAMLTNLRISLNISNDEHLLELRNLISAGTSIHII